MKIISQIFNYILPILYLGALTIYYLIFFNKKKELERHTTPILTFLILFHGLSIIFRLIALKMLPLTTIFDSFSFLAFSLLVVYLVIELTLKNKSTGIFVLTLAFIFKTISTFHFKWYIEKNEILANPTFAVHAAMTVIGYTAFSLSAIYAILYIIQHYKMKRKKFDILSMQLPPLTYLERMSIHSVLIGIILLGAGIFLGHFQALQVLGKFWLSDPKIIITDLILLFYFVGYLLSQSFKLRGRWMAVISLTGYIFLLGSAIVLVLVSKSFHVFY